LSQIASTGIFNLTFPTWTGHKQKYTERLQMIWLTTADQVSAD